MKRLYSQANPTGLHRDSLLTESATLKSCCCCCCLLGSTSSNVSVPRCPICLDSFQNPKTLQRCGHMFCQVCIDKAFRVLMVCPVCKLPYGVTQGNQPPGSMNWHENSSSLPGYQGYGTIIINYSFQSGIQGPEHPNPGVRYNGTSRTAYLPNNTEGRKVRDLLKKAFDARTLFTIGTSRTTGLTNQITWNDIHHKTSTHGGPTG